VANIWPYRSKRERGVCLVLNGLVLGLPKSRLYGLAIALGSSIRKCKELELSIDAAKEACDAKDWTFVKSQAVTKVKNSMKKLIAREDDSAKESSDSAIGTNDVGTKGFALLAQVRSQR
jgi:hypothetical protein